jgi:hypothetical protein
MRKSAQCAKTNSARGGVIQDKQARRRRTKKIIGSILHEGPVVKGGIKKKNFVDIKQCEARSSKQRLKEENRYREEGSAKIIVTKNDSHSPENTTLDLQLRALTSID